MKEKNIIYIGNKLANKTVTTIDTLSGLLIEEGYMVKSYSSCNNKIFRFVDMLLAIIKNKNWADLVLIDTYSTQNFYYAVFVAKLCRTFHIPYIPILHGGNLPNRLTKSPRLSKKLFKNAKINVAPSHYLLEAFKNSGFNNLAYIPNTIEIKKYPFLQREKIKAKLLWVRSFASIYNPVLALDIVEELLNQGFDASLCMVGPEKDGSLEKCKAIAQQKKLPVTFTGKVSKKEWIHLSKEYDIFINTTNFDNTPVSVIEAMALGLPVVSTNVGGLPFLITNNKTGILVPPNNAGVFVKAIKDLLANPKKAIQVSKNARLEVEKFDWEQVKQKWFKIL